MLHRPHARRFAPRLSLSRGRAYMMIWKPDALGPPSQHHPRLGQSQARVAKNPTPGCSLHTPQPGFRIAARYLSSAFTVKSANLRSQTNSTRLEALSLLSATGVPLNLPAGWISYQAPIHITGLKLPILSGLGSSLHWQYS